MCREHRGELDAAEARAAQAARQARADAARLAELQYGRDLKAALCDEQRAQALAVLNAALAAADETAKAAGYDAKEA